MFTSYGAKILDGTPNYLVVEDIGRVSSLRQFENLLQEMIAYVKEKEIDSVSIVLNEKDASNFDYHDLLRAFDFSQQETQYFYKRDLSSLFEYGQFESIEFKSIDQTGKDSFTKVWKEAAGESLNVSSALSIDKEFNGMKSELGPDFTKNCLIAIYDKTPIGITIPHIESGTLDEGRLFYFGLVPKYRNKGWGTILHKRSLQYLKNMGATNYIGATGHRNLPMQRIFEINGCRMFEKRIIYRKKDDRS